MIWLKDTDGQRSATVTFAAAAVVVVLLRVLIGGVSVAIGGHTVQVAAMDATLATGVLAATLGAYVHRRWTDAKYPGEDGTTVTAKTETTVTQKETP